MTSVDLAPPRDGLKAANYAAPKTKTPSKRSKVTGDLAVACLAMVREGLELDQAAKRANITTRMLRIALAKQHVISWLREQRDVFQQEVRASNIHRAREIRDAANNMPAMHAIRYLDGETEGNQRVGSASMPGFVIVLQQGDAPAVRVVEHERDIDGTRER
jgi:hypothetical protein